MYQRSDGRFCVTGAVTGLHAQKAQTGLTASIYAIAKLKTYANIAKLKGFAKGAQATIANVNAMTMRAVNARL